MDETDELPSSLQALEAPRPGRRAKKPAAFLDYIKGSLKDESARKGLPVRIDAEDAINRGVPAEYIYINPNVADRSKLRLRNPSIFGTRYGTMSGTQQQLRSLDMDNLDPVDWGFDNLAGGRLEPDDVGDLIRRSFEGDETALQRGAVYDEWAGYNERLSQRDEFNARFPEGAVEQRGKPITRADLDAMEPPATAYEDLPQVGGRVGNINLANVETRGDIRRLLQNVETKFGGFDAARRGKVTQAETEALASELGMTADDLLRRRAGQALNAEQALAARQLLAKSADEVLALAQKVGPGASDEQRAAFARAITRHAAIHEQVTGATAEAGRALAQFKMAARSKALSGRIHENMVGGAGGADRLEDVAARILELQRQGAEPGSITRFAVDALKPSKSDYFVEYYYNALLSGVSTHIVNTASNLATQLTQIPEHAIAATIGGAGNLLRKVAGQQEADRVLFSEVGARAFGTLQGTKEGLRAFAKVMRTGEPIDPMTKVEASRHKVIPNPRLPTPLQFTIPERVPVVGGRKVSNAPVGSIIRTPTRLLMAEDEFFKAMARRSSMAGLAVRKAHSSGLKGSVAKARVAELTARPTDDMVEQSFNFARYLTFQTPLGSLGQMLTAATNKVPIPLKLIFPFIRTPINLFKYSLERVPVGQLALKRVRDDYVAGGARRDLAVARATFGAGIGALVGMYASQGKVTGRGPDDPSTRKVLMAGGWQPYSIKVGDQWFSYSRTDPYATLFGVAADLATYGDNLKPKQLENAHLELLDSILSQIESKTWLSGVNDFIQAMDAPERFGSAWAARMAGSLIPTVVAHSASSIDPVMRDTKARGSNWFANESIRNRMQSRIPGLSDSLPAMRDVWGEEIRKEGGSAANFLSPFYMRTDKDDPVADAVLAAGVGIGKLKRSISDGMGGERELTDAEYTRYDQTAGRYMREDLAAAVADPEWKNLDQRQQAKEIKAIVGAARKAAREELFGDPDDAAPMPGALPPLPKGAVLLPD